ncbi:MAG: inositol monophosphatase [Phycisphaerales bacterium]|nr:inositol monophosphatase [Phycisphaerales bacterium]
MDENFLQGARGFAESLVARAGEVVREMSGRTRIERKADDSMVTEADRRVEALIRGAIADRFPDHAFVGEEMYAGRRGTRPMIEAEYCWVVDPIDGTRNFAHRFPMVATSIALMRGDRPVVGVVTEHTTGTVYSAVAGEGAHCDGRAMRVNNEAISRDTLVAVPSGRHQPILPIIRDWVDRYVLRNVGSTALHMAYVAAGAVDAAFGYECKLWDVAAGALLIDEAGGRCTGLDGRTPLPLDPRGYDGRDMPFFCASPAVFEALLASLAAPGGKWKS